MSVVTKVQRNIIGIKALKTAFAAKMWKCGRFMTLAPLSDSSRLEHFSILSMHTAVGTVTFSNHFCSVEDGSNSRPEGSNL
jgi:hypothetical protein